MDITFQSVIDWINTPFIHIGESPVTVSGIITSCFIVIFAIFISKIVQKAVGIQMDNRFKLDKGMSYAIQRFIHYGILVTAVMIAVQAIGLNLGSLAFIFGFLSVGIGFGLQNITSNFISGLILLIERPISVGDFIDVGGQIGTVIHVKMRSTIVMTLDNVAIIVPNSQLIENQVTNWSIEDQKIRIHCPVGVAYGSDIPKVKQSLLKVAQGHPNVLKTPAPDVRFEEFGDSSLNFELLFWIRDPKKQDSIRSDMNYKIDDAFRDEKITIPFPQRDLHIQSTPILENALHKKL